MHDRAAVSEDGDLDTDCIPLWALELVRNKWRELDTISLGISTGLKPVCSNWPKMPARDLQKPSQEASQPSSSQIAGRSDPSPAAAPDNNPCDPSAPKQLDLNY